MNTGTIIMELGEKMGLLAAASLVAVLFPPLRKRLLGLGHRRDKMVAMAFGIVLSAWGSLMGLQVLGEHMDIRAAGILIGAILGGARAGIMTGVGGGVFHWLYFDDKAAHWGMIASILDGSITGFLASRRPSWFAGYRVFSTTCLVQLAHAIPLGVVLGAVGRIGHFLPAGPAHLVQILVCTMGVTLFVTIARIMIAREENAVALLRVKAEADAAALDSLRRRLEPHFLFNALNTLRASIRTNPSLARALVSDLADLYRYLLRHPQEAALEEEVGHACAYLDIERARLGGNRLSVHKSIPRELRHIRVPALLLQPIVENAVKHGIAAKTGAGDVRIEASQLGTMVEIRVIDHCEGAVHDIVDPGHGIALQTLRARLEKQYGAVAGLHMQRESHGTTVIVRMPITWPNEPGDSKAQGAEDEEPLRPSGPHPALWQSRQEDA